MNPKIDKLSREILKVKAKINEQQAKLRDLEKQKNELENTDIVALVRSYSMTPQELAEFLSRGQRVTPAVQVDAPKEDRTSEI